MNLKVKYVLQFQFYVQYIHNPMKTYTDPSSGACLAAVDFVVV